MKKNPKYFSLSIPIIIFMLFFNCNNKKKTNAVKVDFNIYKKEINFFSNDENNLLTGLPYIVYFVKINNLSRDTILIQEKLIELRKKNIITDVKLFYSSNLGNRTDDIMILPNSKTEFRIIPELCLLPNLNKTNYHFYEKVCDSSKIIIKYRINKNIKKVELKISSSLKKDYYINDLFYRKKLFM